VARVCPACGGSEFRDRILLVNLQTHTCTSCGLIQSTIERTSPAVPEFALVDQVGYIRSVGKTRRLQAKEILGLVLPHSRPGDRLLDVGCSFGFLLLEARKAGFRVRGVEPDPQAFGYAERLLGEGVVSQGLLSRETVEPGSSDVVCTLDVIEHIAPNDHEDFARLVAAALAPDGLWVIKVPTTEGLYYKMSDVLGRHWPAVGASLVHRLWQTRYEFPHLVYFARDNLARWLDRYGFDVVQYRYLPEVPAGTIVDRLTTDGDIPRTRAYLLSPAMLAIEAAERLRRKSDSLVVLARPRG
jgi:SAM-dependent methyltransferase